jgi:uncharacterized surface protein with fasciclin (FAS1) repeats
MMEGIMPRGVSIIIAIGLLLTAISCTPANEGAGEVEGAKLGSGQSGVTDEVSQPDIVKVAVSSPDHKTLVTAVQKAELVDVLSNNGPFTVFAPTDAAFAKLPAGTVEELIKPENKEKLQGILYHHVQVSVYTEERLRSSSQLIMFDGKVEPIKVEGGDIYVGGAKVLGSVRAANGIVYVVDNVILAD